jgi:hypothetical protein
MDMTKVPTLACSTAVASGLSKKVHIGRSVLLRPDSYQIGRKAHVQESGHGDSGREHPLLNAYFLL